MPKKWADSLFPGTWYLPNGDVFSCDKADLDYYYHRTKEIIDSGYPIPVCLEHQPSVGMSANDRHAEQTLHTVGHCHDTRIGEQGQLQLFIDGDEEAHEIFRRNKYFSPEIRQNVIDTRNGKRWPGPSIVHLACTPRPVQVTGNPHISLSSARAVSLSSAAVSVSLSHAVLLPVALSAKEKPMAFPPKKKDDPTTPDIDESETPEPAASTAEPDADDAGGMSGDAHLITTLSEIVKPLGIEVQVGPGMSLQDYVEHLCTAFKTHQATKGGDTDPADDPNAQTNPNNQQEPELPENAPIMMSTTAPTDREKKMAAVIMKQSTAGLTARIGVLFQRGFIDDAIRKELSNELGNIKLSMSDLSDDGTVKPNALSIQVAAYERQMKAGKPGPFAKTVAAKKIDPNKPISSSIALSAAEEAFDPLATGIDDTAANLQEQNRAGEELAARA
jgi:hypothetical protein